ncbi:FAD-dependent oxidoreductase [Gordonia soli]|uniref:Putative NADH dehydrogenase n=1 Tax=Gordonia soli NBRC 108243 TaxID=1223545 RepID=M0QRQ8_9ACTN|nr:FAD-dependent oxidoreductase [Gordonia soli]GAC70252.1 putative NADH dehydrogenase [Gordonia soli NBRC 108243]
MTRPRVVVAGLGDSGLLTAIHLARHAEVVGVSVKPGLVSGQELGTRLSRPDRWSRDYWVSFDRYRGLDGVRTVHGDVTGLDIDCRRLSVRLPDGTIEEESYDILVIATGVSNGFWRRPTLQTSGQVDAELRSVHDRLASAHSIAVIGGGAAAVSSAANLAQRWPSTRLDLYFPGDRALPQHHPRTWRRVERILRDRGVGLHPGHRALIPADSELTEITDDPVTWSTGQPDATADAVLWAIGRVRPNTAWVPSTLLDDDGFVRVGADLRVPGHDEIFAIGDVAATDPLRSSARNRADKLLARNIRAALAGRRLGSYRAPRRRWGSVLGTQPDGLQIFAPNGPAFRLPSWSVDTVLQPVIVRRIIYRGIRRRTGGTSPDR